MTPNLELPRPPSAPRPRARHAGTRTCVGCGERVEREERSGLVRIALVQDPDGRWEAHADVRGSSFGRGAWVHARLRCLEKAVPKGLARSAKGPVSASVQALAEEIVAQAERRVRSLVASARRAHVLALGADATVQAIGAGAPLVLVAVDARAAAELDAVRTAVADGRAMAFGTKAEWGGSMNRSEVAVMAVLDAGIARAIREAISLAGSFGTLVEKKARLADGQSTRSPEHRGLNKS